MCSKLQYLGADMGDCILQGFTFKVNSGTNIKFWSHKWLGEVTLQATFPRLFMLSTQKLFVFFFFGWSWLAGLGVFPPLGVSWCCLLFFPLFLSGESGLWFRSEGVSWSICFVSFCVYVLIWSVLPTAVS